MLKCLLVFMGMACLFFIINNYQDIKSDKMEKQTDLNNLNYPLSRVGESQKGIIQTKLATELIYENMPYQNQFNSNLYNQIKIQHSQFPFHFSPVSLVGSGGKNSANQQSISPSNDLFQIQKRRKKQKYRRSTNNSHKKFISAIRRLFYAVISTKQKQVFQTKYIEFRSCRTFFFIILAYMKYRFSQKLLDSVRVGFINEMKIKINQYQEEIKRSKDVNLRNFREEEIIDIKFSIKSCNQYFQGDTRNAIQCMYKKDKSTVIKRQHFQSALRSIYIIEKDLKADPRSPLSQPYIEEYSLSSDKQKMQKKVIKRQIRQTQNAKLAMENISYSHLNYPLNNHPDLKQKLMKPTATSQYGPTRNQQENTREQKTSEAKFLFPPLLQPIPFIRYDPFNPPFRSKNETQYQYNIKEDFFGYLNYGFPKFFPNSYLC